MSEATRPRATNQLPITRNHLYALGTLAIALAVLSFFVGFQAGRGKVAAPPPAPAARLVPEEVRSGDLEVLLAGVEHAQAPDAPLAFPAELAHTDPPPVAPDPNAPPVVPDPNAPPAAPVAAPFPPEAHAGSAALAPVAGVAPSVGDIPTSGWAIQVGQYDVEADATRYVETLQAAGLSAYKVVALVDGHGTWRVRIGGFASKDGATAALSGVASKAGAASATVTPAP